jgi:hypothetical protein
VSEHRDHLNQPERGQDSGRPAMVGGMVLLLLGVLAVLLVIGVLVLG